MASFVKEHLGPVLHEEQPGVKIIGFDHNKVPRCRRSPPLPLLLLMGLAAVPPTPKPAEFVTLAAPTLTVLRGVW